MIYGFKTVFCIRSFILKKKYEITTRNTNRIRKFRYITRLNSNAGLKLNRCRSHQLYTARPKGNAYSQNDDNTILCLSCGFVAEQNLIFYSKDFVRAEGQQGKEKIKLLAYFL